MIKSRPIPIKTNAVATSVSPYPSPTSPTGMAFSPSQCIANYPLSCEFLSKYKLGMELGFGGFGFVYSATRLSDGVEVACKFIFKSKIVRSSWTFDKTLGRIPMEIAVLKNVDLY
jgi:serine/threonine protein kinase